MMSSSLLESKEYRYTALQVAAGKYGESLNKLSEEKRRDAEKIALKQYEIQSRILSTNIAVGVVISDNMIDKSISEIIGRYTDTDEFIEELESNGLDMEAFRYAVDRELRVESVMDIVSSSATESSETDARIYYYLHPEKFQQPETRDARHILITENPDYPENCREQAMARAESISNRLKKKPARFAEQALKNSECPTAMNGGVLGRIKLGVLFPSVEHCLFSMREGEVSGIIESPLGFHVVLCEKIYPEGLIPAHEIIPTIIEKMNERNQKNHQREWLSSLLSN